MIVKDALPEIEAGKLALAKTYLNPEQLKKYEQALECFYGPDPCYGVIDPILRLYMPKGSPAAKDLAEKRHQLLVRDFDQGIRDRKELMEGMSDPKFKSSLMDTIQTLERSKEHYRQKAIREYRADIPV